MHRTGFSLITIDDETMNQIMRRSTAIVNSRKNSLQGNVTTGQDNIRVKQ